MRTSFATSCSTMGMLLASLSFRLVFERMRASLAARSASDASLPCILLYKLEDYEKNGKSDGG